MRCSTIALLRIAITPVARKTDAGWTQARIPPRKRTNSLQSLPRPAAIHRPEYW